MSSEYVEHANAMVKDIEQAAFFLTTAMPSWRVRGRGRMDWFGKPIEWLHVDTESSYIALQSSGEGSGQDWKGHTVGVRHIGLIVPSLDAVIARLSQVGFLVDHMGPAHRHRKSAYFIQSDNLQFEFVEYWSELPSERNEYEVARDA